MSQPQPRKSEWQRLHIFRNFPLTGLVGYESTNAVSLLNWQNTMASLGASAVAPIFTGGRLRAGVDQAQAVYRQSLAQYEKTVLMAYQEVEDQLAALRYLEVNRNPQASAVMMRPERKRLPCNATKRGWSDISTWSLRRRPNSAMSELLRKSAANSWSRRWCSSRHSAADGRE